MFKKVEEYMERYHMIEEGDTIVAGVSGGADSVCLFYVLTEYCKKKQAKLVVVHMNHGIREDAVEDAKFVEKLCREWEVTFYLYEKDIQTMAKELGIGTEEAGRKARYEAFEEVRMKYGKNTKIAVAHNRNDLAETTVFHMLRGSGIAGLSGILPVRDYIIRPLLGVERKEIEAFLEENHKTWCIDSTNKENTYTRNKLRNVVFPYVEKEICEQAVSHVANAAEEVALVREYLEKAAKEAEKALVVRDKTSVKIQIEAFRKQHPVIQKQIILNVLGYLVPSRKDFGAVHIRDILSLFEKESGKQVQLPYGFFAMREFEHIKIAKLNSIEEETTQFMVTVPGKVEIEPGRYAEFSLLAAENNSNIIRKTYTKWFDYDKIISCLVLRTRRTGDYLTITEDGKKKKIKEYFIEEKVPRTERDSRFLLADGNHILWVIGMRISEAYKVTDETKRILQVTIFDKSEY